MARIHRISSFGAASVDFQYDDVALKLISIEVLNRTTRRWVHVEIDGITRISEAVPPGRDWLLVLAESEKIPYRMVQVLKPDGSNVSVIGGIDYRVSCGR